MSWKKCEEEGTTQKWGRGNNSEWAMPPSPIHCTSLVVTASIHPVQWPLYVKTAHSFLSHAKPDHGRYGKEVERLLWALEQSW